ncbi:ABC transporter substrate-binding protein [soil metagenome]
MAGKDLFGQHWQNLHEAIRTESIDRRTMLKVAGAAAAAMGLSSATGALAAPSSGARRVITAGQAANNVLVYGSGQDISNLDPHTGHDYSIAWGQKAVYDSILRYTGNPATLAPLLATEVTGNTDASEWTIKLTDKAIFHDGSAVTSEAVQYNFQRMLRKNLGVAWMFANVMDQESVTIVDPSTLKVTLTKSFAPFDAVLPWLFVANPTLVQANDVDGDEGEAWLASNEAGSGPYTISKWEIGSSYQFDLWADYWFKPEGVTMVDSMIWQIIRESSTKRISMETGEVQIGDTFTPEDYEALGEAGFTVNTAASITPFAIKLNNQVGPTSDVNVRKALQQCFDYDAAIAAVSGYGEVMQGPLATGLKPWHKDDLVTLKFDMDGAKASLAASAYPDGFDLEYVYVTGLAIEEQFGLILLESAAELGINVQMTPLAWPDMVARASDKETAPGAMAVYAGTDYADPDNFLWQAYHSSQAGGWSAASHYINPAVDALLEEGRSISDAVRREEIYDEVQQTLVDDAVEIWVYTDVPLSAWVTELTGTVNSPIMGGDLRDFGYGPTS